MPAALAAPPLGLRLADILKKSAARATLYSHSLAGASREQPCLL